MSYLSFASILRCSIWFSSSAHAAWIPMFFRHSSVHCADKASSSTPVFCCPCLKFVRCLCNVKDKLQLKIWLIVQNWPDGIFFPGSHSQYFHCIPKQLPAIWWWAGTLMQIISFHFHASIMSSEASEQSTPRCRYSMCFRMHNHKIYRSKKTPYKYY